MSGIVLSPQHGVNPSLELCFWCQKERGLVLFGRLKGDAEAPRKVTVNKEPCDECKGHMDKGIVLISTRDPEKHGDDPQNPYRTGGWVVVTEDALRRWVSTPETLEHILKTRVAFMPDEVWDAIGLPRTKGA